MESLLGALATTKTRLVSAGDENVPFLRLRRRGQEIAVAVEIEVDDGLFRDGSLLFGGFGRLLLGDDGSGSWNVRLGLIEPALDTVSQRDLVLGGDERGEEGEEKQEAHGADGGEYEDRG